MEACIPDKATGALPPWERGREALQETSMNLFDALKRDHERVACLFTELLGAKASTEAASEALFAELSFVLDAHRRAEEEIVYPILEANEETRELAQKAYEEHQVAHQLLNELATLARTDAKWGPKLLVLKETVERHVQSEEKNLLKKAARAMTREEADRLGALFEEHRASLESSRTAPPPPPPSVEEESEKRMEAME
jgi:iron-sulfur cluster repair protein YtfE (RIC family)